SAQVFSRGRLIGNRSSRPLKSFLLNGVKFYYTGVEKDCVPFTIASLDAEEEVALLAFKDQLLAKGSAEVRAELVKMLEAGQVLNSLKVYYFCRAENLGRSGFEGREVDGLGVYEELVLKLQLVGPKRALIDLFLLPEFREWLPNLRELSEAGLEDVPFSDAIYRSERWAYEKIGLLERKCDLLASELATEKIFDLRFNDGELSRLKLSFDWSKTVTTDGLLVSVLNRQLNVDSWVHVLRELVPLLSLKLESFSIPPIESSGDKFSICLESILLSCLKIDSEDIEVEVLPQDRPGIDACTQLLSPTAREGLLDLKIEEKGGLEVKILVAVETDPSKLLNKLQDFAAFEGVSNFKVKQEGNVSSSEQCYSSTASSYSQVTGLNTEVLLEPLWTNNLNQTEAKNQTTKAEAQLVIGNGISPNSGALPRIDSQESINISELKSKTINNILSQRSPASTNRTNVATEVHLVVPSLPDISPSYTTSGTPSQLPSTRPVQDNMAANSLYSDCIDEGIQSRHPDPKLLLKVISVRTSLEKVHIRIHNSNRDLLYRLLGPFIEKVARRHSRGCRPSFDQRKLHIRPLKKLVRSWLESLLYGLASNISDIYAIAGDFKKCGAYRLMEAHQNRASAGKEGLEGTREGSGKQLA
ncbi:hypothetical protein L0F63_006786, partial [Massospora cicadina]